MDRLRTLLVVNQQSVRTVTDLIRDMRRLYDKW